VEAHLSLKYAPQETMGASSGGRYLPHTVPLHLMAPDQPMIWTLRVILRIEGIVEL
jgi:hypothetical protein